MNEVLQYILGHRSKPIYAQVYERWRRARGQNPKITLRQVCDEMGVSYTAISSAKYRATKKRKKGK